MVFSDKLEFSGVVIYIDLDTVVADPEKFLLHIIDRIPSKPPASQDTYTDIAPDSTSAESLFLTLHASIFKNEGDGLFHILFVRLRP